MSRNKRRKKQGDRNPAANLLSEWQRERLERDRDFPDPPPGPSEVTVLAHYVPRPAEREASFRALECALRETWRNCGMLRTVVVAAAGSPELAEFAKPFGPRFEVQIEPSLDPDAPETVAADRAANLPRRFATSWVLVVSGDAFPIRPGLGSYMDRFDFVGAPHALSDAWIARTAASLFGVRAMDGAFSLRTRALCERVAEAWKQRFPGGKVPEDFSDGLFATRYLPSHSISFRREMRLPSFAQAHRFAHGSASAVSQAKVPFGFSGVQAFAPLCKAGLV